MTSHLHHRRRPRANEYITNCVDLSENAKQNNKRMNERELRQALQQSSIERGVRQFEAVCNVVVSMMAGVNVASLFPEMLKVLLKKSLKIFNKRSLSLIGC